MSDRKSITIGFDKPLSPERTWQWFSSCLRDLWRDHVIRPDGDRWRAYFRDQQTAAEDYPQPDVIVATLAEDGRSLTLAVSPDSEADEFAGELKEVEDEETDRQRRDALRSERRKYISPDCCEAMRRTRAVVISIRWWSDPSSACWQLRLAPATLQSMTLYWEERAWLEKHGLEPFAPPPSHCPFCGRPLPSIVRRAVPPSPLQRWSERFDRCETCGEEDCTCWSPEHAFEVERDTRKK